MLVIPLQPIASQILSVTLGSQSCQISVYEKETYTASGLPNEWTAEPEMYLDLYVNNVLLLGGVACRNGVRIVRDAYFGFIGDLLFFDMQGSDDPVSTGLGSRFQLAYLEASDITTASV